MTMRYKKYYKFIKNNQAFFENALRQLNVIDNIEDKLNLCIYIAKFATLCNTGYFTSSTLESFLTDMAKQINVNCDDITYKPKSFLHVMTEGYNFGGHTRVVERWIKNASQTQLHSVIFTGDQKYNLPVLEKNVYDKNGSISYLDSSLSIFEKAAELRKIAMNYEYVILHVHMYDIIPLLAFGVEEFKRPVLLYNHASHMFWIGKSIADVVLDIVNNDDITKIRRNINDTFFLGVPSEEIKLEQAEKLNIREKLKLPKGKKIIISTGSHYKYYPVCDDNFINLIEELVNKDTYCYVIGIDSKDKVWKRACKRSKGHIIT